MSVELSDKGQTKHSSSPAATRRNTSSSLSQIDTVNQKKQKHIEFSDDDSGDNDLPNRLSSSVPSKTDKVSGKEWLMMEDLSEGVKYDRTPLKHDGYLMKRRKWPMKGWHKRYFVLEKGILIYARTPNDIDRQKLHGEADVGLSCITYKPYSRRIHIDNGNFIFHVKEKNPKSFDYWIKALREHRLYRQNMIQKDMSRDLTPITSPLASTRSSLKRKVSMVDKSQVGYAWLADDSGMEMCNGDLKNANNQMHELGQILERLHQSSESENFLEENCNDGNGEIAQQISPSPNPSTKSKRIAFKKKKKESPSSSGSLHTSSTGSSSLLSSSNPNLSELTANGKKNRPMSFPQTPSPAAFVDRNIEELKFKEDFLTIAKAVHDSLNSLFKRLGQEKEKLKVALEHDENLTMESNNQMITSLKQALNESTALNEELTLKLSRIQAEASIDADKFKPRVSTLDRQTKILTGSMSLDSTSLLEFYDAQESLRESSAESSDDSEEEGTESDDEDAVTQMGLEVDDDLPNHGTGRRTKLPVRQTFTGANIWGILRNNMGRDLSKISMPITLNEPLGALQRLCEELEYSDLLDKAASTEDPIERMVLVAAFSISCYAYTFHRPKQKPFNPLLGETYECIREDMGWKFIGEQVSHHPPISAAHCISKNFIYWLDVCVKMKLYGRSCEVEPSGLINLIIPKFKDHYKWNKVKTCIHNILMGECWIEHEGVIHISSSSGVHAKIKFFKKGGLWQDKRHQVVGSIHNAEGEVVQEIFGKWNEGIYCGKAPSARCVWRPGTLPEDSNHYFNFSRFAIELNEIEKIHYSNYAPTDTRFRPDQRALEEGRISDAESEKINVEQLQRERRKQREIDNVTYKPKWFQKSEENESYVYNGKYWDTRKESNFEKIQLW